MTEIIIELDYSHTQVMHPADVKTSVTQKEESKSIVFLWRDFRKNSISYYSSALTLIYNHNAEVYARHSVLFPEDTHSHHYFKPNLVLT